MIRVRTIFASSKIAKILSEEIYLKLSIDERKIINYLMTSNTVNITHAALLTERSWPTASKAISSLVDRDIIEPITKQGKSKDSSKIYRLRGRYHDNAIPDPQY